MSETLAVQQIEVRLAGRDEIRFSFSVDASGQIQNAKLAAIGCPPLLRLVEEWRQHLKGALPTILLPSGNSHAEMLLRECFLKAQGQWDFPYKDAELCHCRAIPTVDVDAAIVAGASNVATVSRRTSAGTSCGTCRRDIEAVLRYRVCAKN